MAYLRVALLFSCLVGILGLPGAIKEKEDPTFKEILRELADMYLNELNEQEQLSNDVGKYYPKYL